MPAHVGDNFKYFTVYKPFGVLCQFSPDHPGQVTLASLATFPKDVYPVGRLDADSEGLVLLTNDNLLKNKVLSPRNHVGKTYWCQVEGQPVDDDLNPLEKGIRLRINQVDHLAAPAMVRILHPPPELPARTPPIRFRATVMDTWVEVILTEGKNRQVRRMLAAVGFPVLRLVRVAIGGLQLGDMLPGAVMEWQGSALHQRIFRQTEV